MKIKIKILQELFLFLSFALPVFFISCDIPDNSGAVTGVSLNESSLILKVGGSMQLTASVEPENAINQNVTWQSDETGIAEVSQDGTVTGMSSGTAVITATTEDGGYEAECAVNVYESFITTWNTAFTDAKSSGNNQVKLPLDPDGSYDFFVLWGDGNTDHILSCDQAEATHTYSNTGVYDVEIFGKIEGFGFSLDNLADNIKLLDVKKWGDVKLHNKGHQFSNAGNLSGFSATNAPILSHITNMSHMFEYAKKFNGDISTWDVSNVTDMSKMFFCAVQFDQDIGSWDVGNVTDMNGMFGLAASFNGNIGLWGSKVSKVTDMSIMFHNAKAFSQDIESWDVSSVLNMTYMFSGSGLDGNEPGWYQM